MIRTPIITTLVLVFLFAAGAFRVVTDSWGGMIYFFPENERDPAAIGKVFDFSHLEGRALQMASQKRLLAEAQILKEESRIGIELGHFITKNQRGSQILACHLYDQVQLSFVSADMAVAGKPTRLIVTAPCSSGADVNHIETIWIPMASIMADRPGDRELQIMHPQELNIKIENSGDQWPQAWSLDSVRLFNKLDESKQIEVTAERVRHLLPKPIAFSWIK